MTTDQLTFLHGDCLAMLKTLPDQSVHCCVTSPPYWGLRDYGNDAQIGLERTPEEYVEKLVAVFREVRRVLQDDGTLWLNLGDSYSANYTNNGGYSSKSTLQGFTSPDTKGRRANDETVHRRLTSGLKPKDLVGIPWRVAFALQADGWYLRQDIVWSKPNPMPESVTDRCTKSHEYVFLLSKSPRYYYDAVAIMEPASCVGRVLDYTGDQKNNATDTVLQATRPKGRKIEVGSLRNKRDVWTIATQSYSGAHFAVFPSELPRNCILAGTSARGACADCGAPFVRVVSAALTAHDGKLESKYPAGSATNRIGLHRQAARERGEEYQNTKKALCWRPACRCSGLELLEDEAAAPARLDGETDDDFQKRHDEWQRAHDCWGVKLAEFGPRYDQLPTVPCCVLDPFNGSGTTGMVALESGRRYIGIDLNAEYIELARQRCAPALAAPSLALVV
jgi:DNA modification methylase